MLALLPPPPLPVRFAALANPNPMEIPEVRSIQRSTQVPVFLQDGASSQALWHPREIGRGTGFLNGG